jgi:AcrR family transcriptional regulator
VARAGLTPHRLALAGADLADEVGFEQVTASALARRFGVKVASLYSHVRGTQDLRTRIALLALEELADLLAAALAGRSGAAALAAYANTYRDYARTHPGRWAAMQLRLDADTAAASAGRRHVELTRAILRGYDVAEADHPAAVRLLGSAVHGYVELEASGGFSHSAPDSQETWPRVLDALDALLRHWPEPR